MASAAAFGLCAMLGACGEPEPLSQDEILARAETLPKPQPGLYRATTTLTDYDLPGASPQDAAMMRERFGGIEPQMREGCLGPADAERGFLAVIEAMQQGSCTASRFDVDGNDLAAAFSCTFPDGTVSDLAISGTSEAERSRLESTITQTGPGIPGERQELTIVIENERLGDCPTLGGVEQDG